MKDVSWDSYQYEIIYHNMLFSTGCRLGQSYCKAQLHNYQHNVSAGQTLGRISRILPDSQDWLGRWISGWIGGQNKIEKAWNNSNKIHGSWWKDKNAKMIVKLFICIISIIHITAVTINTNNVQARNTTDLIHDQWILE